MTSDEKQTQFLRFTLRVTGLIMSNQRKADLEKSAEAMADLADSLGYLDPLDEEPALVFNPKA